jgi:hypothetical protein
MEVLWLRIELTCNVVVCWVMNDEEYPGQIVNAKSSNNCHKATEDKHKHDSYLPCKGHLESADLKYRPTKS